MSLIRKANSDGVVDIASTAALVAILAIVLYPLIYVVSASISDPYYVSTGRMWLLPRGMTLDGYRRTFQYENILIGYRNTIFYTLAGTLINIVVTMPAAYALSRRDLPGVGFISLLFVFTMFFSGGLIPTYLVVRGLGMLNTRWALLIPGAVAVYNLIIARSFFRASIPEELRDASMMDGCGYTRFFISVVMPLSKAVLSVIVLYYAVAHWNSYFPALIYLRNRALWPMQNFLRDILIVSELSDQMMSTEGELDTYGEQVRSAELVKYAVIVVSTLPILCLYPLLQKYFMKGVMLGAVKG